MIHTCHIYLSTECLKSIKNVSLSEFPSISCLHNFQMRHFWSFWSFSNLSFFQENVKKKICVFTWCLEPGFVVHWHWIHLARDSRRPFFSLWLIVTRSPVGGMVRLASHYSKVPNKHTCAIRIIFSKKSQIKISHFFPTPQKLFQLILLKKESLYEVKSLNKRINKNDFCKE